MNKIKNYFRSDPFSARILTFGMIPLCLRISISVGKWWTNGETVTDVKFFGIVGILIGSLAGHLLYYYWIFPEKRKRQLQENR